MIDYGLLFHHMGLAVRNKDAAICFLEKLGYEIGENVYDANQEVNLIFCRGGSQPDVEVIYPTQKSGPLDSILSERDALIYHTCYSSKNIEMSVDAIKASGLRVVPLSPPKPAPLFSDRLVAFFYIKEVGIIEVLQE